jgi:hypothetical protein
VEGAGREVIFQAFTERVMAVSESYFLANHVTKDHSLMTSQFDTSAFLDMTMDAPLVKRPPLPVGDYTAIVGEPIMRDWVSPKDPTKAGKAVDLFLEIDVPPAVVESLGLTQSTLKVKDGFILDLTPSGGLDTAPGKNGAIRRYRDALDMNKPGDRFSLRNMTGRVVKVKIGHREYNGDLFEDVLAIAKA